MNKTEDQPKSNSKLTREERRAYWQRQIDLALQSGMPISRYCREHGISLPSLNYWRKTLKEKNAEFESGARNFVRLKVLGSSEGSQAIRLELGRGLYLQFNREPSVAWICEVAKRLRGTQS